jgi:hypothetical protein
MEVCTISVALVELLAVQTDLQKMREDYWRRTELVEAARAQEIASLTEERAWQIIRTLQPFAEVPPDPRNGEGLVKQQALFHRLSS